MVGCGSNLHTLLRFRRPKQTVGGLDFRHRHNPKDMCHCMYLCLNPLSVPTVLDRRQRSASNFSIRRTSGSARRPRTKIRFALHAYGSNVAYHVLQPGLWPSRRLGTPPATRDSRGPTRAEKRGPSARDLPSNICNTYVLHDRTFHARSTGNATRGHGWRRWRRHDTYACIITPQLQHLQY